MLHFKAWIGTARVLLCCIVQIQIPAVGNCTASLVISEKVYWILETVQDVPWIYFLLNMHVILTLGCAPSKLGLGMQKGVALHTGAGMQLFFTLGDDEGCLVVQICLLYSPWNTALLHHSLHVPYIFTQTTLSVALSNLNVAQRLMSLL